MVPRLIRRSQMDIRFPLAQIRLRQMVLLGRLVFESYCFSEELVAFTTRPRRVYVRFVSFPVQGPKRSSRRWYPVHLDTLKWSTASLNAF